MLASMRSRNGRRIVAAVVVAVACAAAPAYADVSTVAVDGPSAEVVPLHYGIDAAPDGTAALVYMRKQAGVDHIFVSRYVDGAWKNPEWLTASLSAASAFPQVAAANDGRVVVTFLNDTRVYSAIAPSAAAPFQLVPIVDPGFTQFKRLSVDMSPDGVAYAAYVDFSFDLRASRLDGTTWSPVAAAHPDPAGILNSDPAKQVKADYGVSVAVGGDGSATLAWSEPDAANVEQVWLRRVTGTAPGAVLRASLDALDGRPRGAFADMTDLDADADGDAIVVFREFFKYGLEEPRLLARRLSSAGVLDPAALIDGLPETVDSGAEFPNVDVNAAGTALAGQQRQEIAETWGAATGSSGTWTPFQLAGDIRALSTAALSDADIGLLAWSRGAAGVGARTWRPGDVLGSEALLSRPDWGVADDPRLAASSPGDFFAVFTQGAPTETRVVAAFVERPAPVDDGGGDGDGDGGGDDAPDDDPAGDQTPPEIVRLFVTPRRMRPGTRLPAPVRRLRQGQRGIVLDVSEAASVELRFERARPGRRARGRCLPPARARNGKRCTRFVAARKPLVLPAAAGTNRFRFQGRLTKQRSLRPGSYRVTAVATDTAGHRSRSRRAGFRLLPRREPRARVRR